MRRATKSAKSNETHEKNFYPRSPCGERPISNVCEARYTHFYPRSPCGERQAPKVTRHMRKISIHALLAESDIARDIVLPHILLFLSTLSLRRATQSTYAKLPRDLIISIHALLAESDRLHKVPSVLETRIFLSTLSLRRATPAMCAAMHALPYFYPRSPCGERHSAFLCTVYTNQFLSTLSLRRATHVCRPFQ